MSKKEKMIYIKIFAIVVLSMILLFAGINGKENHENSINEFQEEQNATIENIEEKANVIENIEENVKEIKANKEKIETKNLQEEQKEETTVEKIEEKSTKKEDSKEVQTSVTKQNTKNGTNQTKSVTSTYNESYFDDNGHLKHYPDYKSKYATLKINSIGVNAPVYFGSSNEILDIGVAHDAGSYFVGEGGSVIMCGHNYNYNFSRFGELQKGSIIEVKTDYGDYFYKLYKTEIIEETEPEKLEIQKDEEILIIYTCYPFHNVEHTKYRYVLFAKKI